MIRLLIVSTFVILFLILSTPLMFAEWIIGKFNMDLKNRSSLAIVNWAFRWVARLAGIRDFLAIRKNIGYAVPDNQPLYNTRTFNGYTMGTAGENND